MKFWNGISFLFLESARAFATHRVIGRCVARNRVVDHNIRKSQLITLVPSLKLSQSKAVAEEQLDIQQQSITSFRSPTFRVYIEDTDAYGVMYNSNYVRAYERALLQYAPLARNTSDDSTFGNMKWVLSSIHNQRFRSSPALGEEYVIRGHLIEREYSGQFFETWELELLTENESGPVVHNSAIVTVTTALNYHQLERTAVVEAINLLKNGKVYERRYTTYHDEYDYHHHPYSPVHSYYIPLRKAMNFFERSRSDFLGGPQSLRSMQVDDDLIWVVTGVDNGRLFLDEIRHLDKNSRDNTSVDENSPEDEIKNRSILVADTAEMFDSSVGKEIVVHTAFEVKRRGMIIECHHTLLSNDGNNRRKLLAQATCTILALKGSTRRPTSNLPQWLLNKFE